MHASEDKLILCKYYSFVRNKQNACAIMHLLLLVLMNVFEKIGPLHALWDYCFITKVVVCSTGWYWTDYKW
jgi:hypothetical protein